MNTKFDQFISEAGFAPRSSTGSEKLRSIRLSLSKSSHDLENLANHYQSVMDDETKAEKLRQSAEMLDKVRKVLFDLQD